MRLIDADALKAVFEEKSSEAVCGAELCKAIISRINEAPTVDAVPVIRCKDCVFWEHAFDDWGKCYGIMAGLGTYESGYCAWAERAEE